MLRKINLGILTLCASLSLFSCKQQAIVVNPGAVVTKDGTDDGLKNVKKDFNDAKRTDEGIKFSISSDLLFPTNSSYLSEKAKTEVSKLALILKESNNKIKVDGYTDATGTVEYNQWLSDKRAVSVKKFLVDSGVAESRITAKGFGQSNPVGDNKTPDGRQKNRRVEVTILDKK